MNRFVTVLAALVAVTAAAPYNVFEINLSPEEAQRYLSNPPFNDPQLSERKAVLPLVRYDDPRFRSADAGPLNGRYYINGKEVQDTNDFKEEVYNAVQFHGQDGLGAYRYGYETPESSKVENRERSGDVTGSYTYRDAEGNNIIVRYWADKDGFHQEDNRPKELTEPPQETPEVRQARLEHERAWEAAAAAARAAPGYVDENEKPDDYESAGSDLDVVSVPAPGEEAPVPSVVVPAPSEVAPAPSVEALVPNVAAPAPSEVPAPEKKAKALESIPSVPAKYVKPSSVQSGVYQPGQYRSNPFGSSKQYQGGQYQEGKYQGGQYEGGQYQGGKYQGGKYQGGQYQGGQYQGGQYQGGQYQDGQYQGGQYRQAPTPKPVKYQTELTTSKPVLSSVVPSQVLPSQVQEIAAGVPSPLQLAPVPSYALKAVPEPYEEPESTGEPRGFFYAYDYPVSVIAARSSLTQGQVNPGKPVDADTVAVNASEK